MTETVAFPERLLLDEGNSDVIYQARTRVTDTALDELTMR
jgi:hypothetical protein